MAALRSTSSKIRVLAVVLVVVVIVSQFSARRSSIAHDNGAAVKKAREHVESAFPLPPLTVLQPQHQKVNGAAATTPKPARRHPEFPDGAPVPEAYKLDPSKFSARQHRVIDAIQHSWKGYVKYAWGHDELLPERKSYVDWGDHTSQFTGIGLTAIEVMDTLWLSAQYDDFYKVIDYLKTKHTFDVPVEVSLFETTIRVLGGLLSCYELSGEEICLTKAHDLGNRLFRAFHTEGNYVLPKASVDLKSMRAVNPPWLGNSQSLSEVTTIQLEFKKLSYFTGDMKFDKAAQDVMKAVFRHIPRLRGGLFSMFVSRKDGTPDEGKVTLGARGDSFYEYIVKQWVLTNRTEDWLLEAYEVVSNGVADHLLVQTSADEAFIAEATSMTSLEKEFKMDHLVCFAVGMFQLGKHGETLERDEKIARDVARTCFKMYSMNPTKLGPEIVRFRGKNFEMYPSPGAHHYILRPEAIEAMFYNARYFPDEYQYWADKGWAMFEAMEKHCKTKNGWQGLNDVTTLTSGHTDKQESFFMAETLKYAFLIGADPDVAAEQLPLDKWVFNTECHPLRIMSGPLRESTSDGDTQKSKNSK